LSIDSVGFERLRLPKQVALFGICLAASLIPAPGAAFAATGDCPPIASLRAVTPSSTPPSGLRISGQRAIALARRTDAARQHPARRIVLRPACANWQVVGVQTRDTAAYSVVVDGRTGRILESWGGYKANFIRARGSPDLLLGRHGAIAALALTLLFIAPFLDPRRPLRPAHMDLLAVVAVMVSAIPYRTGAIGWSTPLAFAGLAILAGRALWIARNPRPATDALVPFVSPRLLLAGAVLLMAARVGYNVAWGGPSDVGYDSVYGAQSLLDGYSIYDQAGSNGHAAAYGPAMHLLYLPFAAAFPLPGGVLRGGNQAQHAAAITFDLLTAMALYVLGRRLRPGGAGKSLAAVLVFGWAACPLSFFGMAASPNDCLIALLIVLALLAINAPFGRGLFVGLAAAAKWVPVVLLPLFAGGTRAINRRDLPLFALGVCVAVGVATIPFLPPGGVREIYRVSVGDLANVKSPLSIWGLWDLPTVVRQLAFGLVCLGALACAWVPRERSVATVGALTTAVLAGVSMALPSWDFAYSAWLVPGALVAIMGRRPTVSEERAAIAWRRGRRARASLST
jgi:Glycosyltransferase family 87